MVWGRAGRGVVAEAYLYGDGPAEGVVAEGGYFLGYFFGLEGRTFM